MLRKQILEEHKKIILGLVREREFHDPLELTAAFQQRAGLNGHADAIYSKYVRPAIRALTREQVPPFVAIYNGYSYPVPASSLTMRHLTTRVGGKTFHETLLERLVNGIEVAQRPMGRDFGMDMRSVAYNMKAMEKYFKSKGFKFKRLKRGGASELISDFRTNKKSRLSRMERERLHELIRTELGVWRGDESSFISHLAKKTGINSATIRRHMEKMRGLSPIRLPNHRARNEVKCRAAV